MGKTTGFMEFERVAEPYRNADTRILDFREIYTEHDVGHLETQGARCMDCGRAVLPVRRRLSNP